MRTSWLLMMASSPFFSQNRLVTSGPNCIPTPRLLGPRPGAAWGSVQSISIISPDWPGCLCLCRSNFLMSSRVTLSSEKRPPWSTRYLEPISVARGSAEKLSENNLNTLVPVSGGKSWPGSGHQGGNYTVHYTWLGIRPQIHTPYSYHPSCGFLCSRTCPRAATTCKRITVTRSRLTRNPGRQSRR